MFESRLLSRLAAAASIVGHCAIVVVVLLSTGVRPFQSEGAKAITVDLVEPDEIKPAAQSLKPPEPEPVLPQLDLKQSVETPHPQEAQPQPPAEPEQKAETAPQPPAPSAPDQHAHAQPAPPQPDLQASPAPAFTLPEPDLTVKYGVTLGLPESLGKNDFDAAAIDKARLASNNIAAFRRHLRTCSAMPDTVSMSDDVWIKLRAVFSTDGRLAVPPVLIEGKASPKAVALAHSAIAALQACQPYTMLPADKYDEWKVLDLAFSPKDFTER